MTMFPAHVSSSNYGVGGGSSRYDCFISLGGGGGAFSDLMAEEDQDDQSRNEETASSSKDNHEINTDDDHQNWLQLSLGGAHTTTHHHQHQHQLTMPPPPPPPTQHLIFQLPEFRTHIHPTSSTPSFFLQPHEAMNSVPPTTLQQEITYYNYLPLIRPYSALVNHPPPLPSSSTSSEHNRPLHVHRRLTSRMDLRVVNPPPRPHSGFWFMLLASQNQAKEPFLPQIPKSYLRIKDGRMTVGLLIKYLVNKLQLGSESEEKSKSGKRA